MASDLSSGCTETIEILDEKEEGEISLEDVSSSEEGHLNYGYGNRATQCSNCHSTQHCVTWCNGINRSYHPRNSTKTDAAQEKENRRHTKESGSSTLKRVASTLQEKNDDLVPISSDSDMEIVGLMDNSKQLLLHSLSESRTKKKALNANDFVSSSIDLTVSDYVPTSKHDGGTAKGNHVSRSHYKELRPPHKRTKRSRSSRSSRRSRSTVVRTRSPLFKKAPRRIRSPKRTPTRSPSRKVRRKMTKSDRSQSSRTYVDMYGNVNKLLKIVRNLDSAETYAQGTNPGKGKNQASSLKSKLSNMIKGISDNNGDATDHPKPKASTHANKDVSDADDEDDLALLRQKALETKQKKVHKVSEEAKVDLNGKTSTYNDDDHDEEDLELRMIALRSAVLKKQNRVQRSAKHKKHGKSSVVLRDNSSFTQSFLDSIPIPSDERALFPPERASTPTLNESTHTEDMELDTDIEKEKEKLPYSPTDKITTDIPVDIELLGIQPSDVSFISVNEVNSSPLFDDAHAKEDKGSIQTQIIQNKSYLPHYADTNNAYETIYLDTSYSPTDSSGICKASFPSVKEDRVALPSVPQFDSLLSASNTAGIDHDIYNGTNVNASQEKPYSPTDTPIYDPDLSQMLPVLAIPSISHDPFLTMSVDATNNEFHGDANLEKYMFSNSEVKLSKETDDERVDKRLSECDSLSVPARSAPPSLKSFASPNGSIITIDDLVETNVDACPRIPPAVPRVPRMLENIGDIPEDITNEILKMAQEPLYMQGVPDVTKDTNKIPTLINRTLVPVAILKSNRQLQQPLPAKKPEPTFKSADMQPVSVSTSENSKLSSNFKPMKLLSVSKKSQPVLSKPVAFQELNDDAKSELSDTDHQLSAKNKENNAAVQDAAASAKNSHFDIDVSSSTHKKKKRTKKRKRKDAIIAEGVAIEQNNNSDNNNGNAKNPTKDSSSSGPTNVGTSSASKGNVSLDDKDKMAESINEAVTSAKIPDDTTVPEPANESDNKVAENERNVRSSSIKEFAPAASSKATSKEDTANNRRQSLDEDEDELRAILLASIAKRAKTLDTTGSSNSTTPTATVANSNEPRKATVAAPSMDNTHQNVSVDSALPAAIDQSAKLSLLKIDDNYANTATSSAVIKQKSLDNAVKIAAIPERKRPSIPAQRCSARKFIKKMPIPASTKVVNNAKRYQNAIVQRKLNLQKAASLHSVQKATANNLLCTLNTHDNKRSISVKAVKSLDTQRIVINLKSDTESDSETEKQRTNSNPTPGSASTSKRPALAIPTTDFERSVDLFLRDVRKKQESIAASKTSSHANAVIKKSTTPTVIKEQGHSSNVHTPLAVRHLPASQQEEYRRLKQQIIERERLKLQRVVDNSTAKTLVKYKTANMSNIPKSDNANREQSSFEESQTSAVQLQNVNSHLPGKENDRRNTDASRNIRLANPTMVQASDKILASNFRNNKQKVAGLIQTKGLASSKINVENIASVKGAALQKKTVENKITVPTLKVLSKDELNSKFVQIQTKQLKSDIATMHDKINSFGRKAIDKIDKFVENNESVNLNVGISESMEKENDIISFKSQELNESEKDVVCVPTRQSDKRIDEGAMARDRSDADDTLEGATPTTDLLATDQDREIEESLITESTSSPLRQSSKSQGSSNSSISESSFESSNILLKSDVTVDSKLSIEEVWEITGKDVQTELNSLVDLSRLEQEKHLMDTEHKLVVERYTVLDDLAKMSEDLHQWNTERDLQTSLVAEVKRLREQLRIAEEKLQLQRNRINMGPKVMNIREKINDGRQRCFKLSRICLVLGTKIMGQDYKIPQTGANLLNNKLKEVANHSRQLSKKTVPSIDIPEVYGSSQRFAALTTCTQTTQSDEYLTSSMDDDNITNDASTTENEGELDVDVESAPQPATLLVHNEKTCDLNGSDCNTSDNNNTGDHQDDTVITNVQLNSTCSVILQKCDNILSKRTVDTSRPSTSLEAELPNQDTSPYHQTKKTVKPYVSLLSHFKLPRNTNPNGVLCPYELMGTCSDEDCQYVHQLTKQNE